MLSCNVHSSSARQRAAGNLWCGRNDFFLTKKSVDVSARCSMICTIMLNEKTSKNLMPSPYLARQMSEREFSGRVAECTHPKS
jgi:hypothetical protein